MNAELERNLRDAGCSEEFVEDFGKAANVEERLRKLRRRRAELLDGIHVEQRKLDCLDYLIFKMNEQTR